MILMWLRAFGEYGTTVVLAYHPLRLPVYVDNLFSSDAAPRQAEAPTILAFAVADGGRQSRSRASRGHHGLQPWAGPASAWRRPPMSPTPVGFDLDVTVGTFHLPGGRTQRAATSLADRRTVRRGQVADVAGHPAGLLGSRVGTVTCGGGGISRVRTDRRGVGYVPAGFGLLPARARLAAGESSASTPIGPRRLVAADACTSRACATATRSSSREASANA